MAVVLVLSLMMQDECGDAEGLQYCVTSSIIQRLDYLTVFYAVDVIRISVYYIDRYSVRAKMCIYFSMLHLISHMPKTLTHNRIIAFGV